MQNKLVYVLMFAVLVCITALAQNNSVSEDLNSSTNTLYQRATAGDRKSQIQLGLGFELGAYGLQQDYGEALKWYQSAAASGNPEAEYYLARMYENGKGVDTNYTESLKWYLESAAQGKIEAQKRAGYIYLEGLGVQQDDDEAKYWYMQAAEKGDDAAEVAVGKLYHFSYSSSTNEAEAFRWFLKAASKRNMEGEFFLGNAYINGLGVEKDCAKGASWLAASANQGYPSAEAALGAYYEADEYSLKDYVQAYKWYLLASSSGNVDAKGSLERLEQKINPDQITAGRKFANDFVPVVIQAKNDTKESLVEDLPFASGTGFFITDDGYLISNYHVVRGAAKVRLRTASGLIDATLVNVDKANDLAILKAPGKYVPLPIASSRTVKLGSTVATVGFPLIELQGFSPKLSKGEIASLEGIQDDPRFFQISLPVQHGNSGGAMVDVLGNVVGVVAAKLGTEVDKAVTSDELPENVNYAIKSSLLLSFLESVPNVEAKLKEPNTKDEAFEDVVKSAQDAAVIVLVY